MEKRLLVPRESAFGRFTLRVLQLEKVRTPAETYTQIGETGAYGMCRVHRNAGILPQPLYDVALIGVGARLAPHVINSMRWAMAWRRHASFTRFCTRSYGSFTIQLPLAARMRVCPA